MNKQISVSIIYRDRKAPRIQIEISPRVAKLIIEGRKNIVNHLQKDLKDSLSDIRKLF